MSKKQLRAQNFAIYIFFRKVRVMSIQTRKSLYNTALLFSFFFLQTVRIKFVFLTLSSLVFAMFQYPVIYLSRFVKSPRTTGCLLE